jgi:hypothetical protein
MSNQDRRRGGRGSAGGGNAVVWPAFLVFDLLKFLAS